MTSDAQGAHPGAHVHSGTVSGVAPADAIIISDAHLLFTGDFKRAGVDLVVSGDGHEVVLHDYFKGEKRAALASPDGAHLTGDIINALTGHTQFAQADGSPSVAQVIGHVTKLAGTATAIRNGVSIILNQGDNVNKGDVVASGSDSTLGITFIDGTVFGLASNAKMVLNEMIYDPNGSDNKSLISLVQGTISFVAGATAKHGDMKVDTPVATMGIRGTAVLVEIDFTVPANGGAPPASFQVLVEPDGTTGSYILFDKTTLTPIATVNQAGVAAVVNGQGGVNFLSSAQLSADAQKIITDVFALKFSDLNNPNTKQAFNQTDSIVPQTFFVKTTGGQDVPVTVGPPPPPDKPADANKSGTTQTRDHIPGPPTVITHDGAFTERPLTTGSTAVDQAIGTVDYNDINPGDAPTVKTAFTSFTYQNAGLTDVTATLTAAQLAAIKAVEAPLITVQDIAGLNVGKATWAYVVADGAFDFLAAGEVLTLTYTAHVDNNFALNNESKEVSFTITITGTNDKPVITTGAQHISFTGGKTTPGPFLTTSDATSGKLSFTDVDLTDTHTVSTKLTSALLSGAEISTLAPAPLKFFETALTASIAAGNDSTQRNTGTIDWSLADLRAYLADFVPAGDTLTLVYTVTVTDSQGATSTQDITVTITGNNTPAVVWVATTESGSTGDWNDKSNWETGTVPTATDDAIIITNQLQQLTPFYPVTINAAAFAKTVTMNDFGTTPPELDNNSTLQIGGAFDLFADSIVKNTGTISVGGAIEVQGTSKFTNSGTLNLAAGGDFNGSSSIINAASGKIELSNGTLNVLVDIANSGEVKVDSGAVLALGSGTINGGTVTNAGTFDIEGNAALTNGTLNNTGRINVSANNNSFGGSHGGETVSNNGAGFIDITGGLTLALASITNGAANAVTVENGASLTLQGIASVIGGQLNNIGTLNLGGGVVVDASTHVASGYTVLKNGALKNTGQINVSGSNTVDGETVSNDLTGAISVTGWLTLDNGSHITNVGAANAETVASGATLILQDTSYITGGKVTNAGSITLNGSSTLKNGALVNSNTVNAAGVNALVNEIVGNDTTGKLDVTGTLTLKNTTISGGAVDGAGTIDVTVASTINNGATLSTGSVTADDKLTLDGVTVAGSVITDNSNVETDHTVKLQGGATIKGASSVLLGAVTNNGTLEVSGPATLQDDTVTNAGTIQVDGSQTLTLNDVTITGGIINDYSLGTDGVTVLAGNIEVAGDSTISNASLYNGSLKIDHGIKLTLDHVAVSGTSIEVDGNVGPVGQLILENGTTISNSQLTVDVGDELMLNGSTITGGAITSSGIIDNVSGLSTITAHVTNTGTIEVVSGTLDLAGGLSGTGTVIIDAGATLQVAGADGQTFTFTGDGAVLELDATALQFTGTIAGLSSVGGAFSITGAGSIATATHDALDFTSSGGTPFDPAKVTLTPGGTINGAANGIVVVQNGFGDIAVDPAGTVTGQAGDGIIARIGANGSGKIDVETAGSVTGTGAGSVGILAENLDTANVGKVTVTQLGGVSGGQHGIKATTKGSGDIFIESAGTVAAGVQFGIRAESYGTGSISAVTDAGSVINSGGSGINLVNFDTVISAAANSTIMVTARGAINSGSTNNPNGSVASGIVAGYYGADATANTAINGTVVVDNFANVTAAAGYGVQAYNWGNGNVTVNDKAGTSVTGAQIGIAAFALSGGTGNVAINVGTGATVTGTSQYGILARNDDGGGNIPGSSNISVILSDGDHVNSGSSGIVASSQATSIAAAAQSSVSVVARGTIHSGAISNGNGTTPAGILAGYFPGGIGSPNAGVHGDVVVTNYADITADAGDGIRAYDYGDGNVTVNENAGTITALGATNTPNGYGNGIAAQNYGAGNIDVTTVDGTAINSGGSGILAENHAQTSSSSSHVQVVAHGTIVSGAISTGGGSPAAGILAGYNYNGSVDGAAHGNVVIDDFASITAAAGTDGIRGFNYGTGTITITVEAGADVNGPRDGVGAFAKDGGNVSVTNYGSVTGGVAAIDAQTTGSATATIDNFGHLTGNVLARNATFTNELHGDWSLAGTSTFTGASTLANAGTIESSHISVVSGLSSLTNTGTIEVQSGSLKLAEAVSGTGALKIDAGATLELTSTVSSGQTVTFAASTGTLALDHPEHFAGTIAGFDDGSLDLRGVAYATSPTVVYAGGALGGTLSILEGSLVVANIHLSGDYRGVHWNLADDGTSQHGTAVTEAPGAITAGLDSLGNATEGTAITTFVTDGGAGATNIQYHWQILDTGTNTWIDGSGASVSDPSYTPGEQDEGHALQVAITFTDANGTVEQTTVSAGTVNPVADQPAVTASAVAIDEDGASALTLTLSNATDLFENSDDSVTVTVTLDHGATLHGAGVMNNGNGIFTLTAHSTADLAGLTITPASEFEGTVSVGVSAVTHDGAAVSTAGTTSTTLTVNPVSDTPTVTVPDTSVTAISLDENDANITISGVIVTPATGDETDPVTVTLHVGHGTLTLNGLVDTDATIDGNNGTDTVTVSGLATDVNAVLATLTYTPTGEYEGADALHVTATSTDGAAAPSAASADQTVALMVNPVSDTPTVTVPDTSVTAISLNENDANITISGVIVTPATGDETDPVTVTLHVGHGTLSLDGSVDANATVDGNNGTDTVTVSGLATDVNAVLATLSYTPTGEYEGADALHVTATSTDGSAAASAPSADQTVSLVVADVNVTAPVSSNHAPVLTAFEVPLGASDSILAVYSLTQGHYSDADSDGLNGIAISHIDADPLTQGVWQYKDFGGWTTIDPSDVSESHALAINYAAELRFVSVDGSDYTGAGSLTAYALDTNLGQSNGATDTHIDVTSHGGSTHISDPVTVNSFGPVIATGGLSLGQDENGNPTISGLSVTDPEASENDQFTLTAAADSGNVSPPGETSDLSTIQNDLSAGVTYTAGTAPTDKVAVTVADSNGASDTVNFIFNVTQQPADNMVTLTGTTNKDVFFGTGYQDQFVFAANSNHDTIMNFTHGQDHIDLSLVASTGANDWFANHVTTTATDTIVTIDAADTILVRGVTNLASNDFILHIS